MVMDDRYRRHPADKIEQAYVDACNLWNTPDVSWRDAAWKKSMACQQKVHLVVELKSKGFVFGDIIRN